MCMCVCAYELAQVCTYSCMYVCIHVFVCTCVLCVTYAGLVWVDGRTFVHVYFLYIKVLATLIVVISYGFFKEIFSSIQAKMLL